MSEFLEKEKTKEVLDFLAKKLGAEKFILMDGIDAETVLGVKWPCLYEPRSIICRTKHPRFVYGKSLEKCLENILKMSCDEKCSFYVHKWNNQKRLYGRIVVVPPNSCLESLLIERDLSGL